MENYFLISVWSIWEDWTGSDKKGQFPHSQVWLELGTHWEFQFARQSVNLILPLSFCGWQLQLEAESSQQWHLLIVVLLFGCPWKGSHFCKIPCLLCPWRCSMQLLQQHFYRATLSWSTVLWATSICCCSKSLTALLLTVWSMDQQHWNHLGAC